MTKAEFKELFKNGPVLMDCAIGTNLRHYGLPIGVITEDWLFSNPEPMKQLLREYIKAGSQIVWSPTAALNRVRLESFGLTERTEELTRAMMQLTHEAVDGHCLIGGTVGTLIRLDLEYKDMLEVYRKHFEALDRYGTDLFGAFTMVTTDECLAAVEAAQSVSDKPIVCSLTTQADGSLHFGGTIYDAAQALEAIGVDALGLNCSVGPDQLESVVENLRKLVSIPLIVKPNAGIPRMTAEGKAIYDMDAKQFVSYMKPLLDLGADMVGGCCGTTPEFIAELKTLLDAEYRNGIA